MNRSAGSTPGAIDWFRYARQIQKRQLRQLALHGQLASQISHLVHMLQCERGASNIWLCSGGRLYEAECRAGAALVDDQAARLLAWLTPERAPSASGLCRRIACALWALEQLPALRGAIRGRQIDAGIATLRFSRIIQLLLDIIPQLNDAIDDPMIAGRLVALYSFMQGKELIGQERALGAQGFARGRFGDELRQRLVDRIDGQQPCFDGFLSFTSDRLRERFAQQCQANLEIEQLRRIACTRQPPPDGGESALRWFQQQTWRLERMRGLEEALIAELMAAVETLLSRDVEEEEAPGWEEEVNAAPPTLQADRPLLPLLRQQARELEQLSRQLASLRDTLEERKLIDRAKGLLISHQQMSEEQAWQWLRSMAMNKNQRMVEIARALLTVKSLWPLTPKE